MAVATARKVEALRADFRSSAQLADLLGVSRSQVTRWLRGAGIDPLNAEKVDLLELGAVLQRERLRPSAVATTRRGVTQPQALDLFRRHPDAAGLRWWSRWEALWGNVTIFDRAAASLRLVSVEELALDRPALVEAAEWFASVSFPDPRVLRRLRSARVHPRAMKLTRRAFASTLAGAAWLPGTAPRVEGARPERAQRVEGSLTDVPGLRVGHWTDTRRPTGCTAILFDPEASVGIDYDGSAPGETGVVLLQPVSPVETVHGLFLTGGGMFGLGAHAGMIRYLEDQKRGFDWSPGVRVPIVPGAVIDDLALGDPTIRPDPQAAYKACAAATTAPVAEGNVGAGAGATVGRMLRRYTAGGMKGGLGTASLRAGDLVIGALAVVNAAGDVLDWRTGRIVAGARRPDGKGFADIVEVMKRTVGTPAGGGDLIHDPALRSTTLVVVATNVACTKTQLTKVAMMANCGAARAIRPYHTTGDGDQLFAVSTRRLSRADVNVTTIGTLAAEVVADAVLRAVQAASSVEGWPAARDIEPARSA